MQVNFMDEDTRMTWENADHVPHRGDNVITPKGTKVVLSRVWISATQVNIAVCTPGSVQDTTD